MKIPYNIKTALCSLASLGVATGAFFACKALPEHLFKQWGNNVDPNTTALTSALLGLFGAVGSSVISYAAAKEHGCYNKDKLDVLLP
jgi:hypothetical protein